ncbi:MAG: EAL domain-containing protein, partial [Gammaproteobacteria bacterium]|nr:EAL domain-containing protein [Gammaproteobacteria bacterium]
PAIVNAHLEKNLLPAGSLELEITEDFLLSQPDAALSTLRALQERGVSLAVDDFGTGYCNLVYLKNMPVDRLKIDRSFIRDVAGDYRDAAVVQAIISLGQNLGLQVLAEGVETAAQRDFLLAEGCDMAQGYFYHPPVPEAEFLQLLNSDPGTAGTIDRLG